MNPSATARLPLMLTDLRLPTIKRVWQELAERSNQEGWPAERFLAALLEQEILGREERRLERRRQESNLPPNKRLGSFDFSVVPTLSQAHVQALAEADGWVQEGANLLFFGKRLANPTLPNSP